jgi:thiamine transport system substrate-binding protein
MLDQQFQADIPLRMFVFPANENVPLPELFTQWAGIAQEPAALDPADIDANRESWLAAWRDVVLR